VVLVVVVVVVVVVLVVVVVGWGVLLDTTVSHGCGKDHIFVFCKGADSSLVARAARDDQQVSSRSVDGW
jgi:hypothetical protein